LNEQNFGCWFFKVAGWKQAHLSTSSKPNFWLNLNMFTGIVEATGIINKITISGKNKSFWVSSPISSSLRIDQSLSHNGVCLTVEEIRENMHKVTAVRETLKKTTLNVWKEGSVINLERCMVLGDRLDGHLVQGHVDATGNLLNKKASDGSWELVFEFPKKFAGLIVEKGSICLDGISLTIFNVKKKSFMVTIVPYTWEHTNISKLPEGGAVNLEFDIIGKYLLRNLSLHN
jgi:riboflavin synthase